jgi:hypothetical protein
VTCLIFYHFHPLLCVPVILPAGADAMAFGVLIAKDEPAVLILLIGYFFCVTSLAAFCREQSFFGASLQTVLYAPKYANHLNHVLG